MARSVIKEIRCPACQLSQSDVLAPRQQLCRDQHYAEYAVAMAVICKFSELKVSVVKPIFAALNESFFFFVFMHSCFFSSRNKRYIPHMSICLLYV